MFSVVLILFMAIINSWSFNRGFSNYVKDNERQRLSSVVASLQSVYMERGGWNWLESQPGMFRQLVQRTGVLLPPPGDPSARHSPPERPSPPRGPRNEGPGRLVLLDADKSVLAGQVNSSANLITLPIVVDEREIGYLGFREPRGIPGDLANVFSRQQMRSYAYAAVAMVLLSALLAIALASRIVRPILGVNQAVKIISGGDFTHQIESGRKDELGVLAKNINHLSRTLKANQNARQQWVAEISHELRTPVAVLQGELEAMQDGVVTIDNTAIDSLKAESVRLGLLINDLHDLSMSDVGALDYQMQPVDPGNILQQRVAASNTLTTQASLEVSVHVPEESVGINGDPKRLAQLFDNLLQNSVRYTDAGGMIAIRLTTEAQDCVVDWTDSSPGVSKEQLPHLFDALFRADGSRSRDTGGSGLGLAIVKKIVEAHGGSVHAYHSDLDGLGIQIRLPM